MRSSASSETPALRAAARAVRAWARAAAERADVEGVRRERGSRGPGGRTSRRGSGRRPRCRGRGRIRARAVFGPLDDDLVGARHPLRCREQGPRIDADRAPADPPRGGAERFAGVDRADTTRRGGGPNTSAKTFSALVLDQAAAADAPGQAPPGRRRVVAGPSRRSSSTSSLSPSRLCPSTTVKRTARSSPWASESRTSVRLNRAARRRRRSRRRRGARPERLVVGDPVAEQPAAGPTLDHLARVHRRRRSRRSRPRPSRTSGRDSETANFAPTGRGAELARRDDGRDRDLARPAARQRSTSSTISFTLRASVRCPPRTVPRASRLATSWPGDEPVDVGEAPPAFRPRAAGTPGGPSAD